MAMSTAKQNKREMSPAQAAALKKAQEAARAKVAAAPKSGDLESLVGAVRELKTIMETQFKMHQDAMDQIKVMLDDVRSNLPKKLDLSYLEK